MDFKKLPTEWIFLDGNCNFISDNITLMTERTIVQALLKDRSQRYMLAKCHYRVNKDGEKEYLTRLEDIPEALKKRPEPDGPFGSPIVQIYKYGERQIDVETGRIKGIN